MKINQIKKIEVDGDCYAVTFKTGFDKGEFDIDQLGTDIAWVSNFQDMVMVAGKVTLKAGDSITDDFGGEPIIGEQRKDAIKTDMGKAYRPTVDYRDAFENKGKF